jgi:hypothetical protein
MFEPSAYRRASANREARMSEIAPEELTRRAQQSQRDKAKIAYGVDDLPYGRTFVYQLIREGKLKAKKCGRRTIITPEAWREHVAALPELKATAA